MNVMFKLLRKYSEFWLIPIALVLFFSAPIALRFIDPTAATYDAGILQAVIAAMVQFLFITGFVYLFIAIRLPQIFTYLDELLCNDFKKLERSLKVKVSLSLFFGLVLCMLILTWAMLN